MKGWLRMSALAVALATAGAALAGCVVAPGPGGYYYAQPAPVYVAPSYYYYGPRYRYWHGAPHHHNWNRGNHWH
jgi:hypothetical protein